MLDDKGAQLSSPSLPRHGNDAANKDYLQSGGSQALGSRQAWDGPYPGLSSPSCGHLLTLCVFLLPDCRSCLVKPSYSLDSHFLDLFLSHFLYSMSQNVSHPSASLHIHGLYHSLSHCHLLPRLVSHISTLHGPIHSPHHSQHGLKRSLIYLKPFGGFPLSEEQNPKPLQ